MADREGHVLPPNHNPIQNPNQIPNQNYKSESPTPSQSFYTKYTFSAISTSEAQINWSHFKPENAGRTDEDAEAHLAMTKDWIDTQKFLDHVKVQRFCSTLVGEVRLWYKSLRLKM